MNNLSELILQVHTRLTPAEKASLSKNIEEHITWLINNDFPQLIQTLYRVDVDEQQLKSLLLHQQNTDAATLISNLIIERQIKKLKTKNQQNKDASLSEDERW
jgi:hypothetical protein